MKDYWFSLLQYVLWRKTIHSQGRQIHVCHNMFASIVSWDYSSTKESVHRMTNSGFSKGFDVQRSNLKVRTNLFSGERERERDLSNTSFPVTKPSPVPDNIFFLGCRHLLVSPHPGGCNTYLHPSNSAAGKDKISSNITSVVCICCLTAHLRLGNTVRS